MNISRGPEALIGVALSGVLLTGCGAHDRVTTDGADMLRQPNHHLQPVIANLHSEFGEASLLGASDVRSEAHLTTVEGDAVDVFNFTPYPVDIKDIGRMLRLYSLFVSSLPNIPVTVHPDSLDSTVQVEASVAVRRAQEHDMLIFGHDHDLPNNPDVEDDFPEGKTAPISRKGVRQVISLVSVGDAAGTYKPLSANAIPVELCQSAVVVTAANNVGGGAETKHNANLEKLLAQESICNGISEAVNHIYAGDTYSEYLDDHTLHHVAGEGCTCIVVRGNTEYYLDSYLVKPGFFRVMQGILTGK